MAELAPVLRHARGVSARSQSSVCVAVTPGGNRGPPLWFTALLLRVLEAFECLSVCDREAKTGELKQTLFLLEEVAFPRRHGLKLLLACVEDLYPATRS